MLAKEFQIREEIYTENGKLILKTITLKTIIFAK
jgi:hypothetical protein